MLAWVQPRGLASCLHPTFVMESALIIELINRLSLLGSSFLLLFLIDRVHVSYVFLSMLGSIPIK